MNLLNKLSNWYFSRSATPYWCILLADLVIIISSSLLVYAMFHGLPATADVFWSLLGTLLVYCIFYMVGFRIFHTYSGVLRYSSFVDLQRVVYADFVGIALIMIARLCFNFDAVFVPISGKMLIVIAVFAALGMGLLRVTVKYFYDNFFGTNSAQRVFIYGVKAGGMSLAKSIRIQKPTQFVLRGFISSQSDVTGKHLMGTRVYPISDDLVDEMQAQGAKALLVSPLKSEEFRENTQFQEQLIKAGIRIYMMPAITEWDGKSDLNHQQLKEVDIEDLLPREKIEIDMNAVGEQLCGQTILITGAAGSIGSEMVRQIAPYKPKCLVLVDQAETPMHNVRLYMACNWPEIEAPTIVTSICKKERMEEIFRQYRPHFVFHAAAYKHVPMMEDNPSEAVQNNIYGTQVIADLAVKYDTSKFVMISTDKAVNPTNVMGCSKRICEIYVQSLDQAIKDGRIQGKTQFVTTRFGNVLGSNGSVIPIFKEQIRRGGPLTVTHPDIIRYFMLIPEACKLVLEAGTMGKGGEIFVFDMGKPVRIADLAKRMILLSGATNVEIKYTGLRDGEKLYEEVLNDAEQTKPTFHPKIKIAAVRLYDYKAVYDELNQLSNISYSFDDMAVVRMMKHIVPEYKSKHSKYEALDGVEQVEN